MTDEIKDELATRIGSAARARRKAARKTLSDVARDADMSVSHLSNVENGLTLVSLPMLARLATALDTSLAELTRDDNFIFHQGRLPTETDTTAHLSHHSLTIESSAQSLTTGQSTTVASNATRNLFVFVNDGSLEADIDGERRVLGSGDAMDARAPVSTTLTALTEVRFVWATVPVSQPAG